MKKIISVVGARPQFIKAAVVSRAFAARGGDLQEIILHTGQHYDPEMNDVFFEEMAIPRPGHQLLAGGGSHAQMTAKMMVGIEEVLLAEKPDLVLVYGDTNSTLAGGLVAAKLNIPVAHVEAGLRSFNRRMPEEVNRILVDHLSTLLFCPTENAARRLVEEGVDQKQIKFVGDVMFDATLFYGHSAKSSPFLKDLLNVKKPKALVTIHRAENTDHEDRLRSIWSALERIAQDYQVILPLHPRTRQKLEAMKLPVGNLHIISPVGYLEMIELLKNVDLVMTDSGGLQKEAFFFGRKCLTLRDETEWTELVQAGANKIVGSDANQIIAAALGPAIDQKVFQSTNCFGDGHAGEKIVEEIVRFFER